jgi:xanthine dehydrogenase accessory factor
MMASLDLDVLSAAQTWFASGNGVTLATVVHTWGSAPRPPGSLLAIREDGHLLGSVSGGCIEDALIDRVRAGTLPPPTPEVAIYGANAEEARRFNIPCGGTQQLVLEAVTERSHLAALLEAIEHDRLVTRYLDIATGKTWHTPLMQPVAQRVLFDGQTLRVAFGSTERLLIVGAGQVSQCLASMALLIGYEVIVCDPREEYAGEWSVSGAELRTDMPDDVVVAMKPDQNTAVVTLSHDPKLDDLALMEALRSRAFYVGAIGSRATTARRRERLLLFNVSEAEVSRLHGPVGLPLGGRTPAEIAAAIVAEMIAIRNGVTLGVIRSEERDEVWHSCERSPFRGPCAQGQS